MTKHHLKQNNKLMLMACGMQDEFNMRSLAIMPEGEQKQKAIAFSKSMNFSKAFASSFKQEEDDAYLSSKELARRNQRKALMKPYSQNKPGKLSQQKSHRSEFDMQEQFNLHEFENVDQFLPDLRESEMQNVSDIDFAENNEDSFVEEENDDNGAHVSEEDEDDPSKLDSKAKVDENAKAENPNEEQKGEELKVVEE